MRRFPSLALLMVFLSILATVPAAAQEQDQGLDLGLRRDFGYGMGNDIQGLFTMRVEARDDFVKVAFLIDDQVVNVDTESPFQYQFSTSDYALGSHTLVAVATTTDGRELRTRERIVNFVSAEESWKAIARIGGPILGLILVLTLIGTVGPFLLGRGRKGFRPGEYGAAGGAVCVRCGLPFSRHFLGLNVFLGKLERCPHCGKWAVVPRASPAELEAAQTRLAGESRRGSLEVEDEAECLRRMIDESRFEG